MKPFSQDEVFLRLLGGLVPDAIDILRQRGRPNAQDWNAARQWLAVMQESGDAVLAVAERHGQLELFVQRLAITLAVMAHRPEGVDLWGLRFNVNTAQEATQ
jgi:hypothetical protein